MGDDERGAQREALQALSKTRQPPAKKMVASLSLLFLIVAFETARTYIKPKCFECDPVSLK